MFENLEIEHSLYDIDLDLLNDFKQIAAEFTGEPRNTLQHAYIHKEIDNYAIIFNVWLFMQENSHSIYFNIDKMMPFASNFYIMEQLRKNVRVMKYLQSIETNANNVFEFAFFLGEELIDWVYDVLSKENTTTDIMELNKYRDYFKLVDDFNLSTDESHSIFMQQKHVTKLLATNITQCEDFNMLIKSAISQTQRHVKKETVTL